ncbi:MAG: RNA polymerase sigma factor [Actinomycetota bacterium]
MITSVEGRPLGDEELVDLARGGDADAYVQLVERYQRLAQRVAFVVTRSAAEAEDATQEAFVKAYYALGRFRSGAPFKPWLLRIVTNEARNRVRSASRQAQLALRVERLDRPSGDAAPSPEAAVASAEGHRALLEAVNRMGEKDRLAISCRYFLELTERETAEVLGWPRGTVKSRLARALARLRKVMEEDG